MNDGCKMWRELLKKVLKKKKKAFFEYTGSVSIVCAINGLIVQLDDLWNSITIGYWIGTVENLVCIFIFFIFIF